MNHEELADLLSQTHPSPANPTLRAESCNTTSDPPLSPRRHFQSQVRTLNRDGRPPSRGQSISTTAWPHTSSLCVQQQGWPPQRGNPGLGSVYGYNDLRKEKAPQAYEDPPFAIKEREVWARSASPSFCSFQHVGADGQVYLLDESTAPAWTGSTPGLKTFGPSAAVDIDNRPKTSRGSASVSRCDTAVAEDDAREKNRLSKFAEGSMNERSAGISSAWQNPGPVGVPGEDNHGEMLVQVHQRRPALESETFSPPPATPLTLKQRLQKLGTKSKHQDPHAGTLQQPTKRKTGLRKSISTWGLRTFGGSTTDLLPRATAEEKDASTAALRDDPEVLNDRKRRAEEAYAQQFGTKRRKSNVGDAAKLSASGVPAKAPKTSHRNTEPAKSILKRSSSSHTLTESRLGNPYSATTLTEPEGSDGTGPSDLDRTRRLSRRELEKENQKLRELLRQREKGVKRAPADHSRETISALGIILPDQPVAAVAPTPSPARGRSPAGGNPVPPVPPLPDREVLKCLTAKPNSSRMNVNANVKANMASTGTNVAKRPAPVLVPNAGKERPVSTILEVDEENSDRQGNPKKKMESSPSRNLKTKENINVLSPQKVAPLREQWEWPDDVF